MIPPPRYAVSIRAIRIPEAPNLSTSGFRVMSWAGLVYCYASEKEMARLTELPGRTLDGKYHLDKLLGQGGMGAVYLATHLGTKRPVALKVIAPQLMANEEFVERFRREAEAAGRLRHPNVV